MAGLTEVLARIAARLPPPGGPVLVAVDGADGAGKTEFADRLGAALTRAGRYVERASIDDFHHPRSYRHARGRTGSTVWQRSFDLEALRRELLDPWRSGSGAAYRRRWHDLVTDRYLTEEAQPVPADGVLVLDAVFAQRPELADAWDLVVWLEVPDSVRVARLAARDGSVNDVADPDQQRYLDAQQIYRGACDPFGSADVVVDNTDCAAPVLLRG